MTNHATHASGTTTLRLKLVGKPLVGFDTKHWGALGNDASAKGRVGGKDGKIGQALGKTGAKVGAKNAPA